jgi:2-hydroxychromene-2-carboxylate isomerase
MPRSTVEFWFDFASTYSYVSAMRVEELIVPSGLRLKWMPFLLGPIFAGQGWDSSPFNVYPAKGKYMWRDMERLCARHDLPLKRPETFPQFALLATRVAVAAADETWLPAYCRAVFHAEYGLGCDITDQKVVAEALAQAGADPAVWIGRAGDDAIKQALKDRVARHRPKAFSVRRPSSHRMVNCSGETTGWSRRWNGCSGAADSCRQRLTFGFLHSLRRRL